MLQLFQFCFLLYPLLAYSFKKSSYSQLCHHHDKVALLQFKNSFTIYPSNYDEYKKCSSPYPKTKSWKKNKDCCLWDGVTCDTNSGHVIELDLSCSQLPGIVQPNSTLFRLSHLQTLNLAYNYFYPSHISPNIAKFASLRVLNLSNSGFMGDVPINFGLLSHLISLDLSSDGNDLKMRNIDKIMRNLTNLRELVLNGVSISSTFPQSLAKINSLTSLQLLYCDLQGSFPSSILSLPHLHSLIVRANENLYIDASQFNNLSSSLEVIDFGDTNLTGKLPEYYLHGSQPPQLRSFIASYCNLYGAIPTWIWNTTETIGLEGNNLSGPIPSWLMKLPSLKSLRLDGNQFTGKVPKSFPKGHCLLEELGLGNNSLIVQLNFFTKCSNLKYIDLSYTSIIGGVVPTFSWPNLSYLIMSSCNITSFPNFVRSKQALEWLDLSDNKIQGKIPTWFYNVGKRSLWHLNISHNNITGGLNLLSWNNLYSIDLRSNSLQGLLPLPPPSTTLFFASNNKFQGEISSSFCDLAGLAGLDLSNNRLSGKLPKCQLSSGRLQILNLQSNRFHGVLPMNFTKDCKFESMNLNNNQFEGKVPHSLQRCKALEVLDLGNNKLNDTFPHWLGTLPELKVLILRSNNFQGTIKYDPKEHTKPFPRLQILDISRNQLCGKLPTKYIEDFKAMMELKSVGALNRGNRYIGMSSYYHDSLVLTVKGIESKYERILSILASFDFSSNKFNGDIPKSIGQLVTLIGLNISHNNFTGHIPLSLANLSSLEFLDISCNKLEGKIPPQLVRLTFLEVFNVSNNQLVGTIPQSTQFSTFPKYSFGGNLGLCGDPLPKCGESESGHQPAAQESEQEGNGLIDMITSISLLEIILLGFGLGAVLGSSIGYCMLSSRKPNWFLRKANRFEGVMKERLKKRSRRQRRTT